MKDKKSKEDTDNDYFQEDISEEAVEMDEAEFKNKTKKLKEEINKLRKEKQEYLDNLQRAKADFVNMRRRDEVDKESYLKTAKADLLLEILPIVDSFEMAFSNKENLQDLPKVWREGIENIHYKLLAVLSKEGVEELNPLGEKFNPEIHTAIGIIETDSKEEDDIIGEVLEKGYTLNGKIIRSPKVKIKQHKD